MPMPDRPVSLQAMLVVRRAQAARDRIEAQTAVQAPRRRGSWLSELFGRREAANDERPEEVRKRAA